MRTVLRQKNAKIFRPGGFLGSRVRTRRSAETRIRGQGLHLLEAEDGEALTLLGEGQLGPPQAGGKIMGSLVVQATVICTQKI